MTTRVVTVRADEPISAAVDRMTRFGFSAMPVVSASTRLIGIVSLLDVLRHRELHGTDAASVEEIMNPEVLYMSSTANAGAVAQRLRGHGELRVMPVVQGGRLVGIVTRGDLLRHRAGGGRRARRFFVGRDKAEHDALFALARERRRPTAAASAPVTGIMTHEVITVGPTDHVALAAELMLTHRHTALPVVDRGRLVGILSEADILADPLAGRSAHATAASVMTRTPITLDVTATVGEARALVSDRGLRTVPVVDAGRLVGVVSRSDLL